jgi:NAD(P)-dependent dehydrogenase (short-subunit alcohol dehydrogenase family)
MSVLKDDPMKNPDNHAVGSLISRVYKRAKKQRNDKQALKKEDIQILKKSVIASNALQGKTFYGDESAEMDTAYSPLNSNRHCYCCNELYKKAHSFYHRLCPSCAEYNFSRRGMSVDLSGRHAIITGGRVKVGYATALKLLRAGAEVTVTTRFPMNADEHYRQEEDYDTWKDRLTIYGLDLRDLKALRQFIAHYQSSHEWLDILINNAAQTIRYPDEYYAPLISAEQTLLGQREKSSRIIENTHLATQETDTDIQTVHEFHELNRFGQQVDMRSKTSWNSQLEDITDVELLEVNLINQISPYLLIKDLSPLLKSSPHASERFVINVTSSEGQFSYENKTEFHPHTNMTKASLNMLTRTSAKEYARDNILMCSVDVGWISTGAKESLRREQFDRGYIPPLDSVDGAARIMHPIIEKMKLGNEYAGKLLKNYIVEEW